MFISNSYKCSFSLKDLYVKIVWFKLIWHQGIVENKSQCSWQKKHLTTFSSWDKYIKFCFTSCGYVKTQMFPPIWYVRTYWRKYFRLMNILFTVSCTNCVLSSPTAVHLVQITILPRLLVATIKNLRKEQVGR